MSTNRIAPMMQAAKGRCRGCGNPVGKGRRSWCSQACVDRALIKLSPSVARHRVHQRDAGVCARCGFDADQAERVLNCVRYDPNRRRDDYRERGDASGFLVTLWTGRLLANPWSMPHLWEADHIVPVIEGGGECELENYRTLCIPCHREETKQLAARRAEARRVSKMPLLQREPEHHEF